MFLFHFPNRIRSLASTLKIVEIALESAPQLATQWFIVFQQNQFFPSYKMTPIQCISVITSSLAIIISLIQFVAASRRQQFVSRRYPPAASLLPLSLFLFSEVGAATTQFRWDLYIDVFLYAGFVFWALNLSSFLLTIIIMSLPCQSRVGWRIFRTMIHIIATGSAVGLVIYNLIAVDNFVDYLIDVDAVHTFRLTFVCCITNMVLGALILPSKEWAPRLFSPVVSSFIHEVQWIADRCCPEKWKQEVDEVLEKVLCVEGEVEVEGVEIKTVKGTNEVVRTEGEKKVEGEMKKVEGTNEVMSAEGEMKVEGEMR